MTWLFVRYHCNSGAFLAHSSQRWKVGNTNEGAYRLPVGHGATRSGETGRSPLRGSCILTQCERSHEKTLCKSTQRSQPASLGMTFFFFVSRPNFLGNQCESAKKTNKPAKKKKKKKRITIVDTLGEAERSRFEQVDQIVEQAPIAADWGLLAGILACTLHSFLLRKL